MKSETNTILSEKERGAIQEAISHQIQPRAASIEALLIVQEERGYVPDETLAEIAELLGIGVAELEGVATFYSLIFRQPVGRRVILHCDSVSCFLCGADAVLERLEELTGTTYGRTSEDGEYTLLPMACLGACDRAPAIMIGETLHGPVDPDALPDILGGSS